MPYSGDKSSLSSNLRAIEDEPCARFEVEQVPIDSPETTSAGGELLSA
jgi:hypothetical protein